MNARKWMILTALFFPFTIATVAAGFLAFVMILLNLDLLLIATVVLWFYFACAASIYAISKDALRALGVHRLFLGFTLTIGLLAALSAVVLVLRG
ncbi:MAG: hypothetical protein QMD00_01530 [Hadesarchaea archaeon]|nr:hypothetical protein [Hadesarchaea archaeon]